MRRPRAARAAASPASPAVAVTQPLAILLQDHVARSAPDKRARAIESVPGLRPLTKVRTTLPVIGSKKSRDGDRWVHVRLPGRPTGHTGWILADQTISSSTEWHVTVKLGARQVVVYRDGIAVRTFPAVVGKTSTPTPRPVLRRGGGVGLGPRPRRPVRARHQRALRHLPGIRGRPRPDRHPRHRQPPGPARERRLARLHPAQPRRHHVDVEAHWQRHSGDRLQLGSSTPGGILAGCNETCARRRCTRRSRRRTAASPSPGSGGSRRPPTCARAPTASAVAFRGARLDALEGQPSGRICLAAADGSGMRQVTHGPNEDSGRAGRPTARRSRSSRTALSRQRPGLRARDGRPGRGAPARRGAGDRRAPRVVARRLAHPAARRRPRRRADRRPRLGHARRAGRAAGLGSARGLERGRGRPAPLALRARRRERRADGGLSRRAERLGGGLVRRPRGGGDRLRGRGRGRLVRRRARADRPGSAHRAHAAAQRRATRLGLRIAGRDARRRGRGRLQRPRDRRRASCCWSTRPPARPGRSTPTAWTSPGRRGATTSACSRSACAGSSRSHSMFERPTRAPRRSGSERAPAARASTRRPRRSARAARSRRSSRPGIARRPSSSSTATAR